MIVNTEESDRLMFRTEDRIAAMEAKLRQMERANGPAPASTLPPAHPSLPLKPLPSLSDLSSATLPASSSSTRSSTVPPATNNVQNTRSAGGGQTGSNSAVKGRNVKAKESMGIFASGSSSSLGNKPTLEELMKSRQKTSTNVGLLKR